MFPLRWNFPFRKKDGSMSTIQDEIDSGGGGGYVLPTASATKLGGVKIGSGLSIDENGVLSATGGSGVNQVDTADVSLTTLINVSTSAKGVE